MAVEPVRPRGDRYAAVTQKAHVNSGGEKIQPVQTTGIPYVAKQCEAMKLNKERCKARPVRGTRLCVGHARSISATQ